MINVGIAGTFSAINRHTYVLQKMQHIRITGRWITNPSKDVATDMDSGLSTSDAELIAGKSDAMIITDAGAFSSNLAVVALRKARHLFLYPSVLQSITEVYQLVKLAREANVILKCAKTGKSGVQGILKAIPDSGSIRLIELNHEIKLNHPPRSHKISEILLGDFELVNTLIKARNTALKATGLNIFSSQPEIIHARLEFDNGSVVNYYCNTIGTQNEHCVTVMLMDSVLRYNLMSHLLTGWHTNHAVNQDGSPIFMENMQVEHANDLEDDVYGFFNLVQSGTAFLSIYDNGFESYVMSDRIIEKALKTLVQFA